MTFAESHSHSSGVHKRTRQLDVSDPMTITQEAEVAYANKPIRKNVHQKPTEELESVYGALLLTI